MKTSNSNPKLLKHLTVQKSIPDYCKCIKLIKTNLGVGDVVIMAKLEVAHI